MPTVSSRNNPGPILNWNAQRDVLTSGDPFSLSRGTEPGAQPSTNTGGESRPQAATNDWVSAHESPTYYGQSLVIPGYSNYAAYKSLTGWHKKHAEFRRMMEARAENKLRGIGGEEAAAYGYKPGTNVRENRARLLAETNEAKLQHQIGQANIAYGYLPTMSAARGGNVFNKALANKTVINGAIENNVGLARDASAASNTSSAEEAARQASINAAGTGMTGSSTDLSAKRRLLGAYLGGRAQTASIAGAARMAGTSAMEGERLGVIDRLKGRQSNSFDEQVANMDVLGSLREARRNILPDAIGQGIETAGANYRTGMLYNQMNTGGGARLPSLSGGTRRASGGFTSSLTGAG